MILVAGGTGHLGRELVPLLVAGGRPVRVLTRDASAPRRLFGDSVEVVGGDVRNADDVRAAMKGVKSVVSAITGFGPGGKGPNLIDHEGNLNLIRAAEEAGVGHFVLLSMKGAAPGHPLELLRMKHRAEEAIRASRLDWTIVRPTVFMELWAGIVGDSIRKTGKTTVFGRGDSPVNFISVRDLARFVNVALNDPGLRCQVVDAGGPDNLTLNQVVALFERASGRTAAARHIPVPVMRLSSMLLRPVRPDLAGMIRAGVVMDTTDMTFDDTELRRRYPDVQPTRMTDVVRQMSSTTG